MHLETNEMTAEARTAALARGVKLWEQLCEDPRFEALRDLPYKIDLNIHGQIIMTSASNQHGSFQAKIVRLLGTLMPGGEVFVETGVQTADSVKTADVTWASDERTNVLLREISASVAPEICVEVKSPSNTRAAIAAKGKLCLDAGAVEFWNCDKNGKLTFFNADGPLEHSRLCPQMPAELPRAGRRG